MRETVSEHELGGWGEGQRDRQRESQAGPTLSAESHVGLKSMNHEFMTAETRSWMLNRMSHPGTPHMVFKNAFQSTSWYFMVSLSHLSSLVISWLLLAFCSCIYVLESVCQIPENHVWLACQWIYIWLLGTWHVYTMESTCSRIWYIYLIIFIIKVTE